MALALLARPWVRRRGIAMTALTVDHGLRAAAGAEARRVAAWMGRRDIPHVILRADGSRPTAAMQALARTRRFDLIDRWCRDHDHDLVLFAHTAEDQAETLWLRVLAESGPDGLSAMAPVSTVAGLRIARPMLTLGKERLVATCLARQQPWIEDPSNRDMAFTRVRLRRLAPTLATGRTPGSQRPAGLSHAWPLSDQRMTGIVPGSLGDHGSVLPAGIVWFQAEAFPPVPGGIRQQVAHAPAPLHRWSAVPAASRTRHSACVCAPGGGRRDQDDPRRLPRHARPGWPSRRAGMGMPRTGQGRRTGLPVAGPTHALGQPIRGPLARHGPGYARGTGRRRRASASCRPNDSAERCAERASPTGAPGLSGDP